MTKSEIIEKYGLQYYKDFRAREKENKRKRALGLIKKQKPINNITVKVTAKASDGITRDRLEEEEKIVARLQRRLEGWWSKQTSKPSRPFILIVEYGNLNKGTKTLNYKVELNQLNLQPDEIEKFKAGAAEVVRDFLSNYGID